ncbi:MAG: hypothetical protein WC551_10835 [Patescibacteria group bacterium]
MSDATESRLLDWENPNTETLCDAHFHMKDFGRWDWVDVSDEGVRIWNLMFDDNIESLSAADSVFSAIAAQSAEGAFNAVAAALGVDPEALKLVAACWYENQDDLPPPVSAEKFMEMVAEYKKYWGDLRSS